MNSNHLARLFWIATALAAVAALSACAALVSPAKVDNSTGSLTFTATLQLQSVGGIASAKVTATNGGLRREAVFPVTGETIAGSIADLPIGDWTVLVEVYDELGHTTHVAEATVRVYPNETVVAELEIEPVESWLELIADLTGFPDAESIENVKVTLTGNRTMTLKPIEGEALRFSGERALPAGDYDFNVGLFGSSTYVADRVYLSPWAHFRLEPGKTTRVVWQAQTGSTEIEASIVDMPHAPRNVEIDVRGEEVWLTWTAAPTGPSPTLYRIYRKEDMFAAFKEVAEVSSESNEHLIGTASSVSGDWTFAVTAVSIHGLESYRSEPVRLADASL